MTSDELELAGSVLYKCEGTKLRRNKRYPNGNTFYYAIEFTNSDPVLIKLFLKFLRKIIKVEENKIKIELFLYPDHDKNNLIDRWSKITKVSIDNFQKIIDMKQKNTKYRPNPLGTCKIRCNGKNIFMKLNEVIVKRLGSKASLIKEIMERSDSGSFHRPGKSAA
jgi:hypothetical protein